MLSRSMTIGALAQALGGRVEGTGNDLELTGIGSIKEAAAGEVTFLAHARNLGELSATRASAVIAGNDVGALPLPAVRVANPYLALARALPLFRPPRPHIPGIHPTAFVDQAARVDATASIGALAVVEAGAVIGPRTRIDAQAHVGVDAVIGSDTWIHPHAVIESGCRLGDRVVIHGGTVIGSDGFGFTPDPARGHALVKVPQLGIVEVADDVEIGANVTIDRATMGKTFIGRGSKIDNLVHLAHNVVVGEQCIIVAQVGVSGSTTLEDRVTLAGQSGLVGHITIGKGATVAARGVPTHDIPPGEVVSGFPAHSHKEERKIMAAMRRLPEMVRAVTAIKQKLGLDK